MFLFKAGRAFEATANYDKAVKTYEDLRRQYPTSNEGRNIDKYIAKAKSLSGR
jgi:TolA-binding protein